MPFYIVDITLPRSWAPVNVDLGGIVVFVHPARRTRQSAERRLNELLEADERARQTWPHSIPFPNMRRTVIEAGDRAAAQRFGEAEAYGRLGHPVPATFRYFALYLRSVDLDGEVLEKHVEVVAGPCTRFAALATAVEQVEASGGPLQDDLLYWQQCRDRWPEANGFPQRLCRVKAADAEQALRGGGILAGRGLQ